MGESVPYDLILLVIWVHLEEYALALVITGE